MALDKAIEGLGFAIMVKDPLTEASVRYRISHAYRRLGDLDNAIEQGLRAIQIADSIEARNELLEAKLANGLPRVLDMGQCNDSYSAVVVALELAKALDCTVNDLPLSLAVSHLEQKAAAVLLTLLHLGVKNIRLGPSLPAYLTPNVLQVLSKEYNIMQTGDPVKDLEMMMEGK